MHSTGWRALFLFSLFASACAPIAPSPSKYGVTPSLPWSPGGEPSGSHSFVQTALEFADEDPPDAPSGSRIFSIRELNAWIQSGGVQLDAPATPATHIVLTLTTRQNLGNISHFQVESVFFGGTSWWFGIDVEIQGEAWNEIAPRLLSARLEW